MTTVAHLSEKVLKDVANTDLHEQMLSVFLARLDEAATAEIPPKPKKITIAASFDFNDAWQQKIEERCRALFGDAPVRYRKDGAMNPLDLELSADDIHLIWSPTNYLEQLKQRLKGSHG